MKRSTIELRGGHHDRHIVQVDGDPDHVMAWRRELPRSWKPRRFIDNLFKSPIHRVRYLRTNRFNDGRRIYRMEGSKA